MPRSETTVVGFTFLPLQPTPQLDRTAHKELIAVGVNKGAFSKSVSEAYWGDAIPEAYQTAKQLINNIRTTPGEGSRYTYVNLEKLDKRWRKRSKKATKLVDRS